MQQTSNNTYVHYDWSHLGGVHAQDGRLGQVEDGGTHHGAEHSTVGDREGTTSHFFQSNLVVAGLQGNTQRVPHALGFRATAGRRTNKENCSKALTFSARFPRVCSTSAKPIVSALRMTGTTKLERTTQNGHRHHQGKRTTCSAGQRQDVPSRRRHSDADINIVTVHDIRTVNHGVDGRDLLQCSG